MHRLMCLRYVTCTLLLWLVPAGWILAQGTLRGKVADRNGETLIGATLVLKDNPGYGTTTDFDGNFSLVIKDSLPHTVVVSYVSFKPLEFSVTLKGNQVLVKNLVMQPAAVDVAEVEISAKAVRSNDFYVEEMKKKSATTIDIISAHAIKKTGDATVTAAVSRVAGVSTNGAFITVRGIGDRYVKTGINGSRIPTLDPFTNNIKLDLFPVSLIDNVIINKTASPDIPADWAGAYLSIETKDYPEQLSVNVESSFGYNPNSTFQEVISGQRSSTDWLGFDNGFRDYNHQAFVNANSNPSTYEQMVALGLQNYYNQLGVNADNWYTNAEDYYKLGLVQLGLLAPAYFNNAEAVAYAKSEYLKQGYQADAFRALNAGVPESAHAFKNNWNTETRKAPLNFSQNISIGNQVNFLGKPLGFIAGLRYYTANFYDSDATANRAGVASDSLGNLTPVVSTALVQQSSIETNGWNALLNASCKLNKNNSISLLFLPNFNGTNRVRSSVNDRDLVTVVTLNQFYEERRQLVYQFKSEHFLPKGKFKIESHASYTRGSSSTPDFKNLQYWINPDSTLQIGGSIGDGIHRYYRYLDEDILDTRLSVEFPVGKIPFLVRKVKIGGRYQYGTQEFNQYDYFVTTNPGIGPFTNEDVNAFLNPDQFDIYTTTGPDSIPVSTMNAYYQELGSPANHTFGNSYVAAAYVMADYGITSAIRVSGGVRMEIAHIFTDVKEFDELGLEKDDPRRVYSDSYPLANPGELNQTSFLPSINLIYKLRESDDNPINIRLNYSKALTRPSIRELSDVAVLDYELRAPVYGNSDLKPVKIDNYDFRFESYFKSGRNLSVSLFYKTFRDHIELINANGYTWQNVDKSNVKGIEIEGRTPITKHLEFGANVTLVHSATTFVRTRFDLSGGIKQNIPLDTVTRSMFGQAPYTVNAILTYKLDTLGVAITVGYNIQGPRLVISSNNQEIPDVYELPRNMLDCKISKSLGKHFSVSFTVKDILNTPIRRSYKYDSGYDALDYDSYRYGTNYQLTFGYKI